MLKKIALLMMLILPMGVFAQNLKFGHINAMEIVSAMPEYTKAQSELQANNSDKTYRDLRKNSARNTRNSCSKKTLFLLSLQKEDKKSWKT